MILVRFYLSVIYGFVFDLNYILKSNMSRVTVKKGPSFVAAPRERLHYTQGKPIQVQPLTPGCPSVFFKRDNSSVVLHVAHDLTFS